MQLRFLSRNQFIMELVIYFVCALSLFCYVHTNASNSEDCVLKDGMAGRCVPLAACAHYVRLLKESGDTLHALNATRTAHCGYHGRGTKVCCPTNSTDSIPAPEKTSSAVDPDTVFPMPPYCGRGTVRLGDSFCSTRIKRGAYAQGYPVVGGKPLLIGQMPWMALLGYMPSGGLWECGGTIITQHHILTAAHCINRRLYLVRVGELDVASEDDGAVPVDFFIKMKIPHEGYHKERHENDIGVLVIDGTIKYSALVKPICLPTDRLSNVWPQPGSNGIIAGWGRTSWRSEQPTNVLYAKVRVFPTEQCQQIFNGSMAVIDHRSLCAGDLLGTVDSCQGDSGGPLLDTVCLDGDNTFYYMQAGVVSYGKGCAMRGFLGIYTKVAAFMPWLKRVVAQTL